MAYNNSKPDINKIRYPQKGCCRELGKLIVEAKIVTTTLQKK
jgi:hypothetical protein